MEKVIELLEEAKRYIGKSFYASSPTESIDKYETVNNVKKAENLVSEALAELKAPPRWETPEERGRRTGELWPEDWAVYYMAWFPNGKPVYISGKWQTIWLKEAKSQTEILSRSGEMHFSTAIICATEAGPPPDGWKPEEEAE